MFIYNHSGITAILFLYVDDTILTCSSDSFISSLISQLSSSFAMKDLGNLHYFLGIEADMSNYPQSILLTQQKYTLDLLKRSKMLDCKPCSTPVTTDKRLSILDGTLLTDPLQYRSLAGALQYLTLTRPDINFHYTIFSVGSFSCKEGLQQFESVKKVEVAIFRNG
ncbi:uncharacterized protein LOC113290572 [Papaver somniferum]|uniref:uncharacterized protein LOC113290572 n=1 Tax=Papaver somniferum TaxID=3469 RepID=UPI000E6F51C1|nr:uncharacterized protein LOC113290572 [Papaver somniferum]